MIKMLSTAILIFFLFVLTLYIFQRQFIYFPSKISPSRQEFDALDMQEITLHTSDGLIIKSWYKAPQKPHAPVIIYLHGNAGHIGYRMPLGRQFLNAGYGLLLLEYQGYGGNEGHPNEVGLYRDARAAMDFLQQQGFSSQQIVLYGESLGTAVATQLATEYPVCGVILQSPFVSMTALARYHYPWMFLSPWDKFDSYSRMKQIHSPLLILHGEQDTIVPFAQGKALFEQASEPKKLISFPMKNHNDLWDNDFLLPIFQFIKSNCTK